MLVKAGIIMSSEVNPEGQPSDTAFRPLTTKSKSWIWRLYARRVCFVFVFSTEDETKLPICFCLFGLIFENAQGNQSKQATPAAMGHHQRVASLGPGYPRVTSEGDSSALSLQAQHHWTFLFPPGLVSLFRTGHPQGKWLSRDIVLWGWETLWALLALSPHWKLFVSTEEGQNRACVWRVCEGRKANHQGKPGRENSGQLLEFT